VLALAAAAVEHYQHALALDPNLPEAHLMLGNEYLERKDYVRAVEEFDIYLRRFRTTPAAGPIAVRRISGRAISKRPERPSIGRSNSSQGIRPRW
jgi:tetratricopeptide (TPR) repeat protein